mgnify:CR=1 FL=1|jgi:hypothetical protein
MNMLSSVKDWILARFSERTSWDGALLVAISLSLLLLGDLVWWAAWVGLIYGIYTLVKPQV